MFIVLGFSVDFRHHLFQSFIIHNVILALLRVVCCRENHEIRCEGIEYWRNSRKAVTTASEVYVLLPQRQQELLHIYAVAWTDVSLAVVEYQKTIDEVCLYILQDFLFTVTDKSFCAFICPDSFRKARTDERYVFPLVFVRRHDQRAPSIGKSFVQDSAQDRCLSRSRLANYHIFKDLTRRFRLCFRKLLFLLLQLRIV